MVQNSEALKQTKPLSMVRTKALQKTLTKLLSDSNARDKMAIRTEGLEYVVPVLLDARRPVLMSDTNGIKKLLLLDVDQFGWVITTSPDCKEIIAIKPVQVSLKADACTKV